MNYGRTSAAQPATWIQQTGAALFRRIPDWCGVVRGAQLFNRFVLSVGAAPVVVAPMRDGTTMKIDLRSATEAAAAYRGVYEVDLVRTLLRLLDTGGLFVDVGANIGFYTVATAHHLSRRSASGLVFAFEPLPANYERLQENIQTNELIRYCRSWCVGLSDHKGDGELTLREDFVAGAGTGNASLVSSATMDSGFERTQVHLRSLDELWEELPVAGRNLSLIKLDIEGHEDAFLRGAHDLIEAYRPTILMEINKPFYQHRSESLDEIFLPLLPQWYRIFAQTGGRWQAITTLENCAELDTVLLVAQEKSAKESPFSPR